MEQLLEHETPVLADRFVFRRPRIDTDLPRLVRLLGEIAAADRTDRVVSEAGQRARMTRPGHDLERDRWVVEAPGDPDRLIASAVVWALIGDPLAAVWSDVHPDWRRRGLGSALLARNLARVRELGIQQITASVDEQYAPGHAFARRHGFTPATTDVEMRAPADVPLATPAWPAGYTVRTYAEVNDPVVLREALNRGFIGHWGHADGTLEEVIHVLHADHARPDGIFLAFGPAGDVAGVCWAVLNPEITARRGTPTGYIDSLAVVPEHRRHGLGRALLLAGMSWLRAHDHATIELSAWGQNERALPLYTGVGFGVIRQLITYLRET